MVFFEAPKSWAWIEMKGPDARDLLHRLTTADVRSLEVGHTASACLLNPQGKIASAFSIHCSAPEAFALEVDSGKEGLWKKRLFDTIDQFTFGEKYSIQETDWTPVWAVADETERAPGESVSIAQPLPDAKRWLRLWGPAEKIRAHALQPDPGFENLRIRAGIPFVDHEIRPEWNPLECGLRSSVADQKGCYPGQEVIEKIISLGSPARRLALLSVGSPSDSPPSTDAGEFTSFSPDGAWALAVVRKTHARIGTTLCAKGKSWTVCA